MVIERIKELDGKGKLIGAIIVTLIAALLTGYFIIFLTEGVNYGDTFLKKEAAGTETYYRGTSQWGDIHVGVKALHGNAGQVEVTYQLPNNINKVFIVNFHTPQFADRGVTIKDLNGSLLFEGDYRKGDFFLYDKSGKAYMEGVFDIIVNGENPYQADYQITLRNAAGFATFEYETIRGDVRFLIFALILIVFMVIDWMFPLFFFKLRHCLDVQDPEPSDFYIAVQRLFWYVYPVIAIVLLLAAIF
jgi:hypothetical protein